MSHNSNTYVVDGVTKEIDVLFRIRDTIVDYSLEEMLKKNLTPENPYPVVDWQETERGFEYTFTWKLVDEG